MFGQLFLQDHAMSPQVGVDLHVIAIRIVKNHTNFIILIIDQYHLAYLRHARKLQPPLALRDVYLVHLWHKRGRDEHVNANLLGSHS